VISDIPDLLRLACAQGKVRLNVGFSARDGHQANLANSGEGWTVHADHDPLVAIEAVLRTRFGKMLERERTGEPTDGSVHPAHAGPVKGQFTSRQDAGLPAVQIDIEEAIARSHDPEGLIG
jgi:hypothetical protein